MQLKKTRVLLTGAGGNMGYAALQLFVKPENQDRYELVIFDLLNTRNQKKFETIENARNLHIVWGDLTNYDDVLQAVNGADYILHAAALIPPEADHHPFLFHSVHFEAGRGMQYRFSRSMGPVRKCR